MNKDFHIPHNLIISIAPINKNTTTESISLTLTFFHNQINQNGQVCPSNLFPTTSKVVQLVY